MLRRALSALLASSCLSGFALLAASSFSPATASARPYGTVALARQDTFQHRLWVSGHAIDAGRSARSVGVRVYVDGHYRAHVTANLSSPYWDRYHHVRGNHRYGLSLAYTSTAGRVSVVVDASSSVAATRGVTHVRPSAGTRVVLVARRYVGHARYRDGGASPRTGFDCSGYTKYVYAGAGVRTLPHNAEAQRHVRGMRRISSGSARPGDLVFYLSGGHAYHVAIYAGHGKQYAAATPRDGIRYQPIWSRSVEYRTVTH